MKFIKGLLSRGLVSAGLLLVVCGCSTTFAAREEAVVPVSVYDILQERDANRVPLSTNKMVNLRGVLTSVPWRGTNNSVVHFQDETGGLVLVGLSPDTFANVTAGDRVSVRGRVSQTRGMEEIVVERVRLEHSGAVPKPRDVWTTD
ncbi:MAG TPA: OB-fold nucleic acid binding domain-containing protein, partial [Candidatus Acidoferrum sp.]|nr:OB-fold nucleic acid binding domain-containing protein [Candidatus Acidoferrum sp.]